MEILIVVMLYCFFYQVYCCLIADEDEEAKYFDSLVKVFKAKSGIDFQ